jgi:two-component system cell cycle sensor histidine kinase/response regulator CckA
MRTPGDAAASQRTVLIVDDEPNTAEIVSRITQNAGFRVKTTTSPEGALKIAESEPFDLIISDIEMPGLRGPALLRELKQRGVKCPVLFISGELTPDNLDDSLNVARAMFLPKPFTPNELTEAIWEAMKL